MEGEMGERKKGSGPNRVPGPGVGEESVFVEMIFE